MKQKPKFKIGDKVRILDGKNIRSYTGTWVGSMELHIGEIRKIDFITVQDGKYGYGLLGNVFTWDERGLELVESGEGTRKMNEYIDFVICKHMDNDRTFLFQAPAYSGLNKGDVVLVDTKHGKCFAEVLQKTLVEKGSDLHDFFIEATHATLPLRKVLGKFTYSEFKYNDDAGNVDQN